ncbi:MAG: hypothetical protein QME70_05785 [Bacillota bacterium]|nr:hypothetical protein [Bacillota bacterium]
MYIDPQKCNGYGICVPYCPAGVVETSLRQSLIISGGSMAIFMARPISAVLLTIAAVVILAVVRFLRQAARTRATHA